MRRAYRRTHSTNSSVNRLRAWRQDSAVNGVALLPYRENFLNRCLPGLAHTALANLPHAPSVLPALLRGSYAEKNSFSFFPFFLFSTFKRYFKTSLFFARRNSFDLSPSLDFVVRSPLHIIFIFQTQPFRYVEAILQFVRIT